MQMPAHKVISVGQLEVLAYTPIECPNQKHFWNLSRVPVTKCAYYLSVLNEDRSVFDAYIDLWAIRVLKEDGEEACKKFRAAHTYDKRIKALVDSIRASNGYDPASGPVTAWGNLVQDGHHRAAVVCALYGPDSGVPVAQLPPPLPSDIEECARECKMAPAEPF